MLTLKEYNSKLRQFRNTQKMTRTMQMVSANKFRKAQSAFKTGSDYAGRVMKLFGMLAPACETVMNSPSVAGWHKPGKGLVILLSSDRGLCGGFNSNLYRRVVQWMTENTPRFESLQLSTCGRRGYGHFRARRGFRTHYEGIAGRTDFATARLLGLGLHGAFAEGKYVEIYLAYNRFKSVIDQEPVIERLLPVAIPVPEGGIQNMETVIVEPDRQALTESLVSQVVCLQCYSALLNHVAGEHGARMTAMEKSTRNAEQLIEDYELLRNKARQSQITGQLIEIVSGAEALKG